jgi:hypothetical protein
MIKRGRPKQIVPEIQPSKFNKKIKYDDGCTISWIFDLNITKKGPIEITIEYPKTYITFEEEQEHIPATKRKYLNPHTGKWVTYARGLALGLIDKKINKL